MKKNTIPKIIHYIWFGNKKKSNLILKCIDSWKKYMPDYKFIEWNESNYDVYKNKYIKEAYENKKYAFVSDYARLDILYKYGGIYLDVDVMFLKRLPDSFLNVNSFLSNESNNMINPGLIFASIPKNKIIKEIMSYYENNSFIIDGRMNLTTIVEVTTNVFAKYGYKKNNKKQIINGTVIYPCEYFSAYDQEIKKFNITNNTISTHLYLYSWGNKVSKLSKKLKILVRKIVGTNNYKKMLNFKRKISTKFNDNNKIGILTYNNALNYGAILQAYALQTFIKSLNYECEIIDYNNHNKKKHSLFKIILNIIKLPMYINRKNKFYYFKRKYMTISKTKYNKKNIINSNKYYNKFIVGSDQVWNFEVNNNDYNYYLSFVNDNNLRMSYAASLGELSFNKESSKTIKKYLNKFNNISVREWNSKKYLESRLGVYNISKVCDPIFLLDTKDWEKLEINIKNTNYIFVYSLHEEYLYSIASQLSKIYNLNVICLRFGLRKTINKKHIRNCEVGEFISYIKNAKIILTDSFHCTAFSILYKKNFRVMLKKNKLYLNDRIISLLNDFKINNAIIDENTDYKSILKNINYSKMNIDIINESRNYVINMLK